MTSVGSLQVQLLSIAVLSLQRQLYHNRSLSGSTVQPAYDFVIVGGGAAGCIVASRLSENPNVPVLLLETGGPPTITSDILPAFYYFNYNWGYLTTPQKYSAFGIRDRRVFYPRGKILGGSHAINNALRRFPRFTNSYAHHVNCTESCRQSTCYRTSATHQCRCQDAPCALTDQ